MNISRRVSVLILYNEKKEVLLQHRTKDASRLPDHWAFFGGGMEEGETREQALSRELLEELEYVVLDSHPILTQEILHEGSIIIKYIFIGKYDERQKLVLHEGQGMAWYRFDQLDKLLISEHDRLALAEAEKFMATI